MEVGYIKHIGQIIHNIPDCGGRIDVPLSPSTTVIRSPSLRALNRNDVTCEWQLTVQSRVAILRIRPNIDFGPVNTTAMGECGAKLEITHGERQITLCSNDPTVGFILFDLLYLNSSSGDTKHSRINSTVISMAHSSHQVVDVIV